MTASDAPAPVRAPEPVPIPVEAPPPRRGARWKVALVGALAVLIVGSCATAIWLATSWMADTLTPGDASKGGLGPAGRGSWGFDVCQWCGDGRYLVVQHMSSDGSPQVIAVDVLDGARVVLDGYEACFVEPGAPVVWLDRYDEAAGSVGPRMDGLRDAFDHVPDTLMRWRLDETVPVKTGEALWEPMAGPAGIAAYFAVDASAGAAPSRIAFGPVGRAVPSRESFRPIGRGVTFLPIGWSSTGRYFAVEGLVRDDRESDHGEVSQTRHVFVLDGRSGRVVATEELPRRASAPACAWLPDSDSLVWLGRSSVEATPTEERAGRVAFEVSVLRLSEDGTAERTTGAQRLVVPVLDAEGPYEPTMVGVSARGPLCWVDGTLYRISDRVAHRVTVLPDALWAPAYDLRRGLAWLELEYDEKGRTRTLVMKASDEYGAEANVVWRGSAEAVDQLD
ncbi:MAG: hypothetical protein N3B11_05355 [Coriobacteriia bacterium]|nr:hypothetical protein [Coriobacteriia bacterium]